MIETYDRFSRSRTFSYLERDVVVLYKAADSTRVFGIPGSHGTKIEHQKISKELKLFLIRLVCGNVPEKE